MQGPDSSRKMPPCPKYNNLKPPHPSTRATDNLPCECTVCDIARLNRPPGFGKGTELTTKLKELLFPDQPPPTTSLAQDVKPGTIKLCERCFARIARGNPHTCTKSEMRANLAGIVKSRSKKSREKVVATSLKTIFEDEGLSQRGGTASLPTGGPPVKVTLGRSSDRKFTSNAPRWSHNSLKRLQAAMNLSDRAIM